MEPIRPERFVVVAISIVLVLYAGSLLAPVATVLTTNNNKSEIWSGWQVLGIGWLGLVFRNFAWLANALAGAAIMCLWVGFRRWGAAFSVLAFAAAWDLFRFNSQSVLADEGGGCCRQIVELHIGAWLWLLSLGILLLSALVLLFRPGMPSKERMS